MRRSLNRGRSDGRRFDATHRVTTEALVFLGELDHETMGENLERATHYEPSPPRDLEALLDAVPFDVRDASFVDVGSGMGRAVFVAARRPFKQIVGIEFSGALHEIAKDNLESVERESWRCHDVRLVRADAARYAYPKGRLVAYFFNPFDAAVLASVLDAIERDERDVALLYHTPVERETIEARGGYELVAEFPFGVAFVRRATAAA
jgi:SAM-dependent methyltransferase